MTQSPVRLEVQEAYERWASEYDARPNALLALEERCLAPRMMAFAGKDIVEFGCGTGRWLKKLEKSGSRSLTGVDFSTAMLAAAKKKCLPSTSFVRADFSMTPLPGQIADCVLVSFAVSHVRDVMRFALEAARILRRGGKIIISDMHPDARSYGWRPTFRAEGDVFEVETFQRTLPDLIEAMSAAGFRLEEMAEPSFGEEEAAILLEAGKRDVFQQVMSLPVIYWAQFSLSEIASREHQYCHV